jgi:hypothetical protein
LGIGKRYKITVVIKAIFQSLDSFGGEQRKIATGVERTSSRAGVAPAEVQWLSRRTFLPIIYSGMPQACRIECSLPDFDHEQLKTLLSDIPEQIRFFLRHQHR